MTPNPKKHAAESAVLSALDALAAVECPHCADGMTAFWGLRGWKHYKEDGRLTPCFAEVTRTKLNSLSHIFGHKDRTSASPDADIERLRQKIRALELIEGKVADPGHAHREELRGHLEAAGEALGLSGAFSFDAIAPECRRLREELAAKTQACMEQDERYGLILADTDRRIAADYRRACELFKALAPQCECLDTTADVIDQIDNWTMGVEARKRAAVEAAVKECSRVAHGVQRGFDTLAEARAYERGTEDAASAIRIAHPRIRARTPEPTAPRLDALLADEQRAVSRVAFLALLDGDVQDAISQLRKLFPNEEISRRIAHLSAQDVEDQEVEPSKHRLKLSVGTHEVFVGREQVTIEVSADDACFGERLRIASKIRSDLATYPGSCLHHQATAALTTLARHLETPT